jgi:hypothetical protein
LIVDGRWLLSTINHQLEPLSYQLSTINSQPLTRSSFP